MPLGIDPTVWPALSRLLDTALDLPVEQRDSWLEALDASHDDLKPHLRGLLARAHEETGGLLDNLPKLEQLATGQEQPAASEGKIIGPYRLLHELGRGGMGAVWLAERTDGLMKRPVALKLPHGSWMRAGLAERMAREREILATLDHPNVARLFDAGLADAGQPYLAIEYVEGVAIDLHCNAGAADALPLRARLQLFLQVVGAVAYAHGKLVLHRDLKPANILVTTQGQARLLDFGIAKLLDEGQAKTTRLTELSGRALTPDYASPEQILGEPLTVASDVYSLGVILYELLTGTRPYRLKRDSRGALEEAILQAEPVRPSEAATPDLRRALRGDLDTIVLKALKKRPQERYSTANALADDLARYLDDRPVLALPDSPWYLLRKFVFRNRLAVSAAAAVAAAVIGGAVLALWQAQTAIREKERAQEVEHFIESIFSDADPFGDAGHTMTAVQLLKSARRDIDQNFQQRPDLRIALLKLVGTSLGNLGDSAAAESALRAALRESQARNGGSHIETLRLRALLTNIDNEKHDRASLRRELDSLLPLVRSQAGVDAEPLVRVLTNQANLAFDEGRFDDVQMSAREAFDLGQRKLGTRHRLTVEASTLRAESTLGSSRVSVAAMLKETARALQFAIAAYDGQIDHVQVIRMREVRARALGIAGYFREAIVEMRQVIDSATRALGPASSMLMSAKGFLGSWERRVGRVRDAILHGAEAITILEKNGETRSANYALMLNGQGASLLWARRPQAAADAFSRSENLGTDIFGARNSETVAARLNHSIALAFLGRTKEALASLDVLADPHYRSESPWSAEHIRGIVLRLAHQPGKALAAQLRAQALIRDNPRAPWERVRVLSELGLAQLDLGRLDDADAALAAAEQLFESLKIELYPVYAEVILARARIDLERGAVERALARLERVDAFWRQFDADSRGAGEAALWLARAQRRLGRLDEAESNSARAARLQSLPWR